MTTRILKLKYSNNTCKAKFIADIKFCGATIEDTVVSLPSKAIYFTIKEPEGNSFSRRFRDTRSSKFLLN